MNNKVLISENFESKPLDIVRRIKEILHEKGGAYSVPAFSKRVGMSDSTFYRCLNGDRYFKPSELERIAEGLNISVARLKREDTQKKYLQMYAQTKHKVNLPYALELALELAPIAIVLLPPNFVRKLTASNVQRLTDKTSALHTRIKKIEKRENQTNSPAITRFTMWSSTIRCLFAAP